MDTEPTSSIPQGDEHLSRRERREVRREEQRTGKSSSRRGRFLRRLGVWVIGIGVIVGIGWGIIKLANDVPLPDGSGGLTVPVSASDTILGPTTATTTLVEYGDFQCPACGAFHAVLLQFLEEAEAKGKVRLVFRNFPLTQIHPNAQISAQAAGAAALQGKFWEMHNLLYENQAKWSGQSDTGARETFKQYATNLGLDIAKFEKDIDSSAVKEKVSADQKGGLAAGVNATPTFFVDGIKMPQPQSYDQFKNFVLKGISPSVTPTVSPTP